MNPVPGIAVRCPVGGLGNSHRLGGDTCPGTVHQGQGVFNKPELSSAQQLSGCVVKLEFTGGRTMNAEFVFDPANFKVLVTLINEKGKSSGSGGSFFGAGHDQGNIRAAVGNESLYAV